MSDEMRWDRSSSGDKSENNVIPPQYAYYQMHQNHPQSMNLYHSNSYSDPNPSAGRAPKKKKNSFGKKLAGTVALAVVFGLVAGVVFQGVNFATDRFLYKEDSQVYRETSEVVTPMPMTEEFRNVIAEQGTVSGVAQTAMPSVVAITSVSIQEIPTFFGFYGFGYGYEEYPSTGSGSGIIVGENEEELLIATNNHVVEGATTLSVCFIGDEENNREVEAQSTMNGDGDINVEDAVNAKIKGTDPDNDLAVIAVLKADIPEDTMAQIKIAQIGNSENLLVGEQVVAIGNALGYGQSVTSGWVSALNRSIVLDNGSSAEVIQTDAAINPGNSGGALLNMSGELIGINSAKYADNAVEGMGYAIPISKAEPILQELMNRQTRDVVDEDDAGYLGIEVADLTAEAIRMYNMPAGAFVIGTVRGEAADRAGIQKGDIIVKMDGQKVSGNDDLFEMLRYYAAGETIEMIISRPVQGEYTEYTVEITFGEKPIFGY